VQSNPDAISNLEWQCIREASAWVMSNQDDRAKATFERFALSIPGEACALMLHWIEVFEQADRITIPRRTESRP
jgi:hypothetical protein